MPEDVEYSKAVAAFKVKTKPKDPNQWRNVPKGYTVPVSYRKWLRMKELMPWKLIKELHRERLAIAKEREIHKMREKQIESLTQALIRDVA